MKVVINRCYGGFSLSEKACEYLGIPGDGYEYAEDRANPKLIECIEKLGEDANGTFAELKIVDIPDDVEWTIEEYDGMEWVSEKHKVWC